MNFSSFKKIYPSLKEKVAKYNIKFTTALWWKIIVVCFVIFNVLNAIFSYIIFKKVSDDSEKSSLSTASDDVINRSELKNFLKFYRGKVTNSETFKNSTVVRKDPSL